MLLNDQQLHEIRQIIADHHSAFVANVIHPSAVDPETLERLRSKGFINVKINSVEDAYVYGQLLAALDDPRVAKMGYDELRLYLRRNPVPLSPIEQRAVQVAQHTAAQYAVGLGRRVDLETGQSALNIDTQLQAQMRDKIRTATAESIAKRQSAQQLKSDLGWATKDWARDWDRIAITETNNALQRGTADHYAKRFGSGTRVAKRVMPDCCEHCFRLYMGPDGQPRIFHLSQLERNGTNHGRKAREWMPVVGSVHPHCFPGETLVETLAGPKPIALVTPGDRVLTHLGTWEPVTHTWVSYFHGYLREIRTKGHRVETTPNHPILTSMGWRPAEALRQGDNVLGLVSQVDRTLPVDLDTIQSPSVGMERLSLALVLFGLTRSGVPVTAVHLNGQTYVREGEIHQPTIKSIPNMGPESSLKQSPVDAALVGRFELTTLGLRQLQQSSQGDVRAADGLVGSLGEPLFFSKIQTLHAEFVGGYAVTLPDSCALQPCDNGSAGNSQSLSYLLHRQMLVQVQFDDEGSIEFAPVSQEMVAQGVPPFDNVGIVNVSLNHYMGLVYNLTVAHANSFVANGIVAHNCQCAMIRVPEGWGFSEEGELVPGGEYGVDYGGKGDLARCMREELDLIKSVKVGHVDFQGLPIAIENAPGTTRHWKSPDGQEGDTHMLFAYGYVEDTNGQDGDEIDVFLGPDPRAQMVYVIHQQNPQTGLYDEDKCMLGFPHEQAALAAYRFHFDRPDFDVAISPMSVDHFRRWVYAAGKRTGDMLKKGTPVTRFVIPLEKSQVPGPGLNSLGAISPEMVETRAEHRAPGPGVGANYLFNIPKRDRPPTLAEQGHNLSPSPREMFDTFAVRHRQGKKNKEDYEYKEPLPDGTLAKPINLPEGWPAMTMLADEADIEWRKKQLIREGLKNTAAVKNKVKVE